MNETNEVIADRIATAITQVVVDAMQEPGRPSDDELVRIAVATARAISAGLEAAGIKSPS